MFRTITLLQRRWYPVTGIKQYHNYRVESSWNVMAHGDARERKWKGNWRMEWVASTLHTTSEHGVSSITTADAHTSAASSRLNWCPRRFKWTRPFRRKTHSGFGACAFTFQRQCTDVHFRQFWEFGTRQANRSWRVNQDPAYLYNYSTNNCLHCNYLTLLHHADSA